MTDIRKLIDIINENTVAGSVAGNELGFASGGIGSKPQRRVKASESQVEASDDNKSRFANAPKQDKVTAPSDLSTPKAPATTESAPQQEVGASAITPKVIEYGNWENSALVTSSKIKNKRSGTTNREDKKKVKESRQAVNEFATLAIPAAAAAGRALAPAAGRALAPYAARMSQALRPTSTTLGPARAAGPRTIDMGKAVEVPKTALQAPAATTVAKAPSAVKSLATTAAAGAGAAYLGNKASAPAPAPAPAPAAPAAPAPAPAPAPAQPSSFGQAFKAARQAAAASGDASTGRFTWQGKEYQTNLASDAKGKTEPYVARDQQRDVGDFTTPTSSSDSEVKESGALVKKNLTEFDPNIDTDFDLDSAIRASDAQEIRPEAPIKRTTSASPALKSPPFISAAPDTDTKAVQIPPTATAIAKQGGFDPNKIQVGQKIPLPDGSTYTVKPGDSLSKILSSYNTKKETLPRSQQPKASLTPGKNPTITQPQRFSAATAVATNIGADKTELMNIIGAAETGANPDLAFGDVIGKDGSIRSTLGKGKDGKSLATPQSMFGKPLSALSVGEVQQFQAARSKQKSGTGAVGAYQFMPGTLNAYVKKLGIDPSEPFNLQTQQKIQQAIMNDNASTLKRAGIDQTPVNMYMAHYVGPSGAVAVNRAAAQNPNMPVAEVLARQQLGNAASDPEKLRNAMDRLTKFNPNLNTSAGAFSSMIDKTLQDRSRTYQTRVSGARKTPAVTESSDLTEQDLVINPAAIKRISGLISKDHDRRDHEVGMARSDLYQAAQNAQKVFMLLRDTSEDEGIEGWVQEKIIKAADYLNTIREYLEGRELGINESKLDEAGLWDNIRKRQASGKKARKPGQKGAPDAKTWRKVKALDETEDSGQNFYDKVTTNYPKTKLALDLFPATAVVASAADTANSLAKRQYGDAALNALGLIPGVKPVAQALKVSNIPRLQKTLSVAGAADKTKDVSDYTGAEFGSSASTNTSDNYGQTATDMQGTPISEKRVKKLGQQDVKEGRFTVNRKTGAKLHPKTGAELPRKEKPLTMKQMFSKGDDREPEFDVDLDDVWREFTIAAGNVAPDIEPYEDSRFAQWLKNHGITGFKIGDVLDAAAKKHGYDSWSDYSDSIRQYARDKGVAEARSPEEFMRQMGKIVTTSQTFEVGDWVTIDPNETEGYASSGMTGLITKLYTDDEGESMAQVNIGGGGGVQTKMKTHGRVFGPPGTTLDLGKGIRSYGTVTVVPTSLLQKHDPRGVAEGSTGVSVRKWANQVRKDHGTDVKFWNRKEGAGAVDSVVAKNSNGEIVGVYNRKTGYPTVFEPKQDVTEGICTECGGPAFSEESIAEAKDACYNKVKSRYKVWPSAYASGALVKCRKVGAANWGNKSKK